MAETLVILRLDVPPTPARTLRWCAAGMNEATEPDPAGPGCRRR
jgi:hypothetical protein